jgi:hypothetical protein
LHHQLVVEQPPPSQFNRLVDWRYKLYLEERFPKRLLFDSNMAPEPRLQPITNIKTMDLQDSRAMAPGRYFLGSLIIPKLSVSTGIERLAALSTSTKHNHSRSVDIDFSPPLVPRKVHHRASTATDAILSCNFPEHLEKHKPTRMTVGSKKELGCLFGCWKNRNCE